MKKGFTLLELLSVIIVVALITLIAVPVISGITTKVRLNALKSSANGLLEASNLYYSQYINTKSVRFDIKDNQITSKDTSNLLSYNGEVNEGTVIINKKGETTVCLTDGKNSVYKNYRDQKVIEAVNKKCNIPSSTYVVYLDNNATLSELSNEELTELLSQIQSELETKANQLDLETVSRTTNSKANQSDLEAINSNLETVSTIASSATLDKIYPIGSIYASTSNTNPSTLFGGTWVQIKDSFLLSAGDIYKAGNTGGSATNSHTHSVTASGTVGSTTLITNQIPSHYHSIPSLSGTAASAGNHSHYFKWYWMTKRPDGYGTTESAVGWGNQNAGYDSGSTGTLSAGEHTHTVTTTASNTGSTGDSGSHNHTFTGSAVTSGGASDTNNMPPYTVVYMWKRTA